MDELVPVGSDGAEDLVAEKDRGEEAGILVGDTTDFSNEPRT